MKLILPSVSLYHQNPGIQGIYQAIAKAGHICYASTKTDDSESFVKRCIKFGHMRPLEFGTVYLTISMEWYGDGIIEKYQINPYSKVKITNGNAYITTNYRVIIEKNWSDDIEKYLSKPTEYHYKRHIIFWKCIGRDIADEFRTHCKISSLMQSSRYVNFSKDKFGKEIICVKPSWFSTCEYFDMTDDEKEMFLAFKRAENSYMDLVVKYHWPAEKARKVLPLGIATSFIQCGFEEDWDNFFNQRILGTTGVPHPDAKEIAEMIYEEYKTAKSI